MTPIRGENTTDLYIKNKKVQDSMCYLETIEVPSNSKLLEFLHFTLLIALH
jgi:hypothetical protein